MRVSAMLAWVALAALTIPFVHAETTAKVVGTWPAGDSPALGAHQAFYVHIRYHSAEPIRGGDTVAYASGRAIRTRILADYSPHSFRVSGFSRSKSGISPAHATGHLEAPVGWC